MLCFLSGSLCTALFPHVVDAESYHEANTGGNDPAHAQAEQGNVAGAEILHSRQRGALGDHPGQRAQEVQGRCRKGEGGGNDIDRLASAKPLFSQRQQDQSNGQRIDEHQHRHTPGHDGGQTKVGDAEGHQAEDDGPHGVFRPLGEHLYKGL